jgi:hypothetical protein
MFPKPIKKTKIRKSIRKIGKIGKINIEANKILKEKYSTTNLILLPPCEIERIGCWHVTHGFAHRHSRVDYRSRPEMLSSVNQTLKACNPCHGWLDAHKKEREELFLKKRGEDELKNSLKNTP